MIKKIIICAMAFMPIVTFAQQDFSVKGTIGVDNSATKAYMIYNEDGQRVIDSADIKTGSFDFKGSVQEPMEAIVVVDHEGVGLQGISSPDMISIYLEKGTILIASKDSLTNALLSGTPLNEDLQKLNFTLKETNRNMQALMMIYRSASDEQMASEDFNNKIQEEYEKLSEEAKILKFEFIKENPNSLVSLMMLVDASRPVLNALEIDPLLAGLSPELQSKPLAQALAAQVEIAKKVAIGAIAPEFTQNDTAGTPVSLTSFRGKYVLLDFWASWCGPCRQENPNIVAAYNKYKDKNFTVLGISLDRPNDREKWLKAIADDKLAWTQVSDLKFWENEVARQYGIRSIPQSYLLDPEGKIIATNLRGPALHEKLAELLSND
jgi:peroxiredoxin